MNNHIIKKQLSAAYRYSYARLALNYYTFYETLCDEVKVSQSFQQYTTQLHELLGDYLEGTSRIEALDELRNQCMETMEVITSYTDCFQIYEYVLNRRERKFIEDAPRVESIEEFVPRLMGFLMKSQDSMVINSRIQEIIGQLPVRFTRQKFYTLLQDGLSVYIGSDKKSLEDMLYIMRTESMVQLPEQMEQEYEDLYQMLQQLRTADYPHMDKEEHQTCINRIIYASERLEQDAGLYMLLQDIINDLYILMLTDTHVLIDAAEKQILGKIVVNVLNEFKSGNTSLIDDEITEMLYELEGIQEDAMMRYLSYPAPDDSADDAIGKSPSLRSAESMVYISQTVDKLLSDSSFVKLDAKKETEEVADRSWVEQQTTQLCEDLDVIFANSKKPVVRAIMAKLLSSLPVVFRSMDELKQYIVGSLESCTDLSERETCIELLNQVMEIEDALV